MAAFYGKNSKLFKALPEKFGGALSLGLRHRKSGRGGLGECESKRGGVMAARLTDKQKKKIIADYVK